LSRPATTCRCGRAARSAHAAAGLVLACASVARAAAPQEPGARDASLTAAGITLYGVVDFGFQYQTHGAPPSDFIAYSTEPVIQANSNRAVTALVSSPLNWSRVGLAGQQPLGGDFAAEFRLESYFNPTSGKLSDGLRSLTVNNGRVPAAQGANLDSSVAGQLFGGAAFAGLSSATYGTVSFGRQSTLLAEGIVKYDPLEDGENSGHAFSLLGGSRTAAGGGLTEDSRLDHSLKYAGQYGWLHAGALYQFGGASGTANSAVQAVVGARAAALSLDFFYAKKYDAIAASPLNAAQLAALASAYSAGHSLAATVSDNTAAAFMGRYRLGTVTLSGGYEHIRFANPNTPLAPGYVDIGGYVLVYTNNAAYDIERRLEVFWAGAKWALTPDVDLAAAYYGYRQMSFATGANAGCASTVASACRGTERALGVLADYRLAPHLDTYLGALWSEVADGLASGYLQSSTITSTVGVRLRF
jgi:predicted porin